MEKREMVARLADILAETSRGLPDFAVMEVCGTHTHAIARYGLSALLPSNIRLVSGPGCPVCVTADETIAQALTLARQPATCVCSFGDMLRVPVRVQYPEGETGLDSLLRERGLGRDVRLVVSPLDVLRLAQAEPDRQFVWFAVGFETTAPATAVLLRQARAAGVPNLKVLCAHKTMPAALQALLDPADSKPAKQPIRGLLCPGHVAAITGANAFQFVPRQLGLAAAISGFEPEDILAALVELSRQLHRGQPGLRNMYPAVVRPNGNLAAQGLLSQIFQPSTATWRGLGEIPASGLSLRPAWQEFDALNGSLSPDPAATVCPVAETKPSACHCGPVLRGDESPLDCPLFMRACTEANPRGPCMVSSEGACAAASRYGTGGAAVRLKEHYRAGSGAVSGHNEFRKEPDIYG
ncbi:MAG: hydrogenase formation protein HypD [Oscillospiraceae bacterium]|nr:hydrogenase formation protein HypD [Oscillospiraceae bacterium]MDD4368174.1 hydrogenase formation protein HypD [Oscillospiraceae bacterium]